MTASPDSAQPRPSFLDALAVYLKPRVLIVLFLGFSSGLPLALSGATLLVWMRESGVDLGTIGLFALVGTPYTVKFLWAPLTDALDVPLLSRLLGRRRGWLVFTQILLMAAIVFLGSCNPAVAPGLVAFGALLVATASATQDIVVDAFRVESLPENEQAAGMASYVAAYRIGMLASTAGALFLVSGFEATASTSRRPGTGATSRWPRWCWSASRPRSSPPSRKSPRRRRPRMPIKSASRAWRIAAFGAFADFLARDMAIAVLAFVVLFKFTDALAGVMTAPFVIDLGFSRNEYATIIKGVGLAATLIGGFAGGFVARAYPLATSLWIGGLLQAAANLAFSWQAVVGARRRLAHLRHRGREFHQRHRHRDFRRLSVGALPKPAAHGDPIRAAHRACRRRPDVSLLGCRVRRRGDRLGLVLRDLRARPRSQFNLPCWPGCRRAGISRSWSAPSRQPEARATRTASAAGSPPQACPRRDSRARRRPARRARAA